MTAFGCLVRQICIKSITFTQHSILAHVCCNLTKFSVHIPLNANPTKYSNTLKQFVCNLPTNCFSVFDHFEGLAFKGIFFHFSSSKNFAPFIYLLQESEIKLSSNLIKSTKHCRLVSFKTNIYRD